MIQKSSKESAISSILKKKYLKHLNIFFGKYITQKIHPPLVYQEKKLGFRTNFYFNYQYVLNFNKTIWKFLKMYQR